MVRGAEVPKTPHTTLEGPQSDLEEGKRAYFLAACGRCLDSKEGERQWYRAVQDSIPVECGMLNLLQDSR